ncbi:hypothetical protein FGG08_006767 [Glutinoglossum americanum]|uniref:Glycosyltransferase family 69 protein n=1 Tax=Glutinoglossum americanum TaxID=1670608 RepID=A0A9P8HXN4_9PEZI|nr:hypothetical protein FGG08_006767 [Glutinoglossum americanum]
MQREDEYELLGRARSSRELEDADGILYYSEEEGHGEPNHSPSFSYPLSRPSSGFFVGIFELCVIRKARGHHRRHSSRAGRRRRRPVCTLRRGWFPRRVCILLAVLTALFLLFSTKPSYTIQQEPAHYHALRAAVRGSSEPGRGNPRNEKVFIAANIINEDLIRGAWGKAVVGLVELLGEDNVYLSIFENDSGEGTREALVELGRKVTCNSSIVSEHLPMGDIPSVTLPSGRKRVKRVAYLAEVRNRALRPLDRSSSPPGQHITATTKFDKLLFINDVIFDPLDAAQLLFSTNLNPSTNLTSYRAACAVDFVLPFKFYDTFATRDLEGYSMGLPLFPWFANVGQAESRKDVLRGTDAVRVRSCWGGMVAFEAKWFQDMGVGEGEGEGEGEGGNMESSDRDDGDDSKPTLQTKSDMTAQTERGLTNASSISLRGPSALRLRSEPDLFWDSSECCLVNADLQSLPPRPGNPLSPETGIYMNPFIRVAYSPFAFASLGASTRRFERALEPLQRLINAAVGLPWHNPRRAEVEGEEVSDRVWVYDEPTGWERGGGGRFKEVKRTAGPGGFCGVRMLLVMKEKPKKGEKRWESLPVPPT